IPLLRPAAALRYFLRLEPALGVDPGRFGQALERQAFTLAAAVEETLLDRVQAAIARRLESGEKGARPGAAAVQGLLDEAGMSSRNPSYGELVWRTNVKDALEQGAWEEYSDPDVQAMMPAWRYENPQDARSRPEHAARAGQYYSASTSFSQVRGTGPED